MSLRLITAALCGKLAYALFCNTTPWQCISIHNLHNKARNCIHRPDSIRRCNGYINQNEDKHSETGCKELKTTKLWRKARLLADGNKKTIIQALRCFLQYKKLWLLLIITTKRQKINSQPSAHLRGMTNHPYSFHSRVICQAAGDTSRAFIN